MLLHILWFCHAQTQNPCFNARGWGIDSNGSQYVLTCSTSMPLALTLVVISSFSLPSRNLFNTASRCSTVISPDNSATEWPSAVIFSANQEAAFRVWHDTGINKCKSILGLQKISQTATKILAALQSFPGARKDSDGNQGKGERKKEGEGRNLF